MTTDPTPLIEEIHAVLAHDAGAGGPSLARLEEVLTVGYARALALEAERLRLERELGEAASRLADGEGGGAEALAGLARRMSAADGDLLRLRTALGPLRERAASVRAAVSTSL